MIVDCAFIKNKNKFQVGNEFSSVEALWSQFENVMARDPEDEARADDGGVDAQKDEGDADRTVVGKGDR